VFHKNKALYGDTPVSVPKRHENVKFILDITGIPRRTI